MEAAGALFPVVGWKHCGKDAILSLLSAYKERVWCVPEQKRNGVKSGVATNTLKRLLRVLSQTALPSTLHYLIVSVVKKAAGLITKHLPALKKQPFFITASA